MVAGNRCWNRESRGNDRPERHGPGESKGDLADAKCQRALGDADKECASYARSAMKCSDASAKTDKLCGVSRYVARAWQLFLWSTVARFLRHIFWRG